MIASSPYQKSIHYFDYLSDQLVAFFYSKAEVFVYPSHYEGFGLPVLEAMTLSCPVISSCNSSLPEVGGNAILYINPNDTEELADRIWQVINDRSLRSELVKRGLYQATLFSWEKTARATLEMYQIANSCHY
jgi:glycosyltransferase involved in cell wall biosynthesis